MSYNATKVEHLNMNHMNAAFTGQVSFRGSDFRFFGFLSFILGKQIRVTD